MSEKILIIDDDAGVRQVLSESLTAMGYEVHTLDNGEKVLSTIRDTGCSLVILDMVLPRTDGMQILQEIHRHHPELAVIMITGYASVETAIKAMKMGAYDYVVKPFRMEEVELVVGKALEQGRLRSENLFLRRQIESHFGVSGLAGNSPSMRKVMSLIDQVASTRTTVLITGSVGTGKDMVARALHFNGDRKNKPFVAVACDGIPEGLLEDDLFGHVKDAFPDAMSDRQGRIEMANGGTLFLDEASVLSPSLQAKLHRVLVDREVFPLGGREAIPVDVRLIAATRENLEKLVAEGQFREDLFYRLNVIRIHLSDLKERSEDVPLLVNHFLTKYSRQMGVPVPHFGSDPMKALGDFDWPGNVRQLENVVERAIALSRGKAELSMEDLPREIQESAATPIPLIRVGGEGVALDEVMAEYESKMLRQALLTTGWVKTRAAELLKIKRTTLIEKMKRLGIPLQRNGGERIRQEPAREQEASGPTRLGTGETAAS